MWVRKHNADPIRVKKVINALSWTHSVPDSSKLDSAMSQTALSWTQLCLRQLSAGLNSVPDSSQLDSTLSQTGLSWTQLCPRQVSAGLSSVPDSSKLDSTLSRTALLQVSWTQLWHGQNLAWTQHWLGNHWVLTQRCPVQCWVNKNLLTGLENRLVTWQTRPHGIEYSKHRWDFYPHSPVFILKFLKMCSILFLHNHEPLHNKNLAHESWNRWAQANISAKSNHVRNFSH